MLIRENSSKGGRFENQWSNSQRAPRPREAESYSWPWLELLLDRWSRSSMAMGCHMVEKLSFFGIFLCLLFVPPSWLGNLLGSLGDLDANWDLTISVLTIFMGVSASLQSNIGMSVGSNLFGSNWLWLWVRLKNGQTQSSKSRYFSVELGVGAPDNYLHIQIIRGKGSGSI